MRINFMANANILIFPIVLGSVLFYMKIQQNSVIIILNCFFKTIQSFTTEHGIIKRKIELHTFSSLKKKKIAFYVIMLFGILKSQ